MPAIPYIKKKIGHSYLLWFQNSNLYLQLEEPAWFVFSKTNKRYAAGTIAKEFSNRYSVSLEESLVFVRDIRLKIEKMNQPDNAEDKRNGISTELTEIDYTPFSVHRYRLGEKLISFSFETRLFEYYLHPLISHFETTDEQDDMPFFELFAYQGRIVFRVDGDVKGIWRNDETHLVKGLIFMFLVNMMHGTTDDDWLMTVHASAITNGKKTILFSAPPNHGKTTFAALLQANGYQLISDDFVPVDRRTFSAYPFPIAMSVKETSVELLASFFPALKERPVTYISPEKSVRFLAPDFKSCFQGGAYPVREYVFIRYDKSVDFAWEKLSTLKAIKSMLDQAWVTPARGNAELLFDRVMQMSFYQLTYSDNQKAIDAIANLFDHD
ncbi:hypothetical protein [Gaoshiqia sp. Z1-71]|uniref:hypothetical protein n=1 Tax=Gaoshiqia hydrogeniformans TaxID=3290090 RepID=UPI003BF830B0